ncbi:hypothetical protein EV189_3745 [Motilibacter rhizosphaerae]|uniref:TadE-like protein n=1 Tax=Motilibacter rhizosphaerae TaxID=598652 RepID=A0A4Q7NAL7_9ACTN|nr:TadE family type IV pilus minor pilin [Motilibacter rhizosphaerae]RZS79392.1 hypothetical protein EV189_3745 [Motilibacter rhizosphaerae]
MVTAEAALALPALVVAVLVAVSVVLLAVRQVQCADAAGAAARAAARGDDPGRVRALASAAAPPGARVEVAADDQVVTVVVAWRLPPGLPGLHELEVTARQVVPTESARLADSP